MTQFFFVLVLLFLPVQLGIHFWPQQAYVLGARIDYLSPTIYFSDVLIILLFISCLYSFLRPQKSIKNQELSSKAHIKKRNVIIFLGILVIILGIVLSKNPWAGWYGFIKLLEFVFLGLYIARSTIKLSTIYWLLLPGFIIECFLALSQFISHGSLGGAWYFLGERTFNSLTPGIATAIIQGEVFLRPYGTFSHPNVLAGYLLILITFFLSLLFSFGSWINKKTIFLGGTVFFGLGVIILTMSRIPIVLSMVLIILFFMSGLIHFKGEKRRILTGVFIITVGIGIWGITSQSIFSERLLQTTFQEESYSNRQLLLNVAYKMFEENIIVGVGINNFIVNLPAYMVPKLQTFLQPVHNIYLLLLSQIGLAGFLLAAGFLFKTSLILRQNGLLKKTQSLFQAQSVLKPEIGIVLGLCLILVLGVFDHYWLTLQQGQILLTLVLGLCWRQKI